MMLYLCVCEPPIICIYLNIPGIIFARNLHGLCYGSAGVLVLVEKTCLNAFVSETCGNLLQLDTRPVAPEQRGN